MLGTYSACTWSELNEDVCERFPLISYFIYSYFFGKFVRVFDIARITRLCKIDIHLHVHVHVHKLSIGQIIVMYLFLADRFHDKSQF